MRNLIQAVSLLTTLTAIACDVDEEVETRVGDGFVGAAVQSEEEPEEDELEELGEAPDQVVDELDPSAAGYCDSVTTWNSSWASFEDQVISLINQRRAQGATCGGVWRKAVPAVAKNSKLRCAARRHSKDMAAKNFFSHTGSNGSTPWQRIKAAGYNYAAASENIAWGYTTPAQVVDGWMKSTGHCDNIMSPKVTQVGVGYVYRADGSYHHLWTQDFGKPL